MIEKNKDLAFLKIPRIFTKNNERYNLDPYEFRVVCVIYDYTMGFNRLKNNQGFFLKKLGPLF